MSSTTSISMRRHLHIAGAALATVASAVFLLASGAQPSLATAFLVAGAASLAGVLWWLWRAGEALLVEPPAEEVKLATGRRRKELEREKQLLLKALKELEFDHEMRKISEADYKEIAGTYRARALRVMRQLDEVGEDYRKVIERDLAARTGGAATPASPAATAAPSAKKAKVAPPSRTACPKCETENDHDALFCKRCATRLAAEEAAQ